MHLRNFCQTIHSALLQTFYRSNWIWKVNGWLQFRKYPTLRCTKISQREISCLLIETFQIIPNFTVLNPVFSFPSLILLKPWTLTSKKGTITARNVSRPNQKDETYLANERCGVALFTKVSGQFYRSNVGNEFGVMFRGKGPHEPEFVHDILRIHSLLIYTHLIDSNMVGETKIPLLRWFPFFQSWKATTLKQLDSK